MWERITNEGSDLGWVVAALEKGTAVWVSDGSYKREVAPHTSGVGWVLCCSVKGLRLRGSFCESSPSANSYRAELLGLLAGHVLIAAACKYFDIGSPRGELCCDCRGALHRSKELKRRVPSGSPQADIRRSLRNCKMVRPAQLGYRWVEGHQDKLKPWHLLTWRQQLNCICDSLAKGAVSRGMRSSRRRAVHQTLPFERAAVVVDGVKQTRDVGDSLRFSMGKLEAEKFYTSELGWSKSTFRSVGWEELDSALARKPDMYREWLAKQASGFCGTQAMVSRWNSQRDDSCPNCGKRETADHILQCPDRERTKLLNEQAEELRDWMDSHNTHPEIQYWIPRYVQLRGSRRLSSFDQLSPEIRRWAEAQDAIGWRNFMEGKIAKELFAIQHAHSAGGGTRMTSGAWARQLVSKVLHITHSQWLFRNESLHSVADGYLRLQRRRDMLAEISELAELDISEVPPARRHLLEIDFQELGRASEVSQSYWLYAVRAARKAGQRRQERAARLGGGKRAERVMAAAGRKARGLQNLGTREVERETERDFRLWPKAPSKSRPTARGGDLLHPSNKRRKPD